MQAHFSRLCLSLYQIFRRNAPRDETGLPLISLRNSWAWGGRYRFEHHEYGVYPLTAELPVDRDGLYWSLLDSFAEQECGDVLRNRSRASLQGCQAMSFV